MSEIRDCLPPVRNPRKPRVVLPRGSIDTHVHVFEPGYPLSPGRGYNPPHSTLADLEHLHATLGMEVTDRELAALDACGVRGVRLNTDNKGGMPVEIRDIPELAGRISAFGWHLEFLFPGKHIIELIPVFRALKVPMSIAHFAYQPASAGVTAAGFRALIELARRGNTWIKISGANRVAATDLPPYDDVKPMAQALIEAAPERIMWGTDWPHPNKYVVNPNDADLVDAFGDWVSDEAMRCKIMVDTPAAFYRFSGRQR